VRRAKGVPANKESDGIVCGFRDRVQKRYIFCPDRFDIVKKSSDEKREESEKKGKGEKKICEDEAEQAEDNSIHKKRNFFDFAAYKGSVAL